MHRNKLTLPVGLIEVIESFHSLTVKQAIAIGPVCPCVLICPHSKWKTAYQKLVYLGRNVFPEPCKWLDFNDIWPWLLSVRERCNASK